MMNNRWRDIACFIVLVAVGSLLYSRTLHIPWLFDDIQNIIDNLSIRDLPGAFSGIAGPRGVAYLSFALNYHFGELEPYGFHLVNIAIHILTSFIIYLILKRVFWSPLPASRFPLPGFLPAAGALIFLAHPLQTQAVNYIVQRMASLCGLFFFLSILLFMVARERLQGGERFFSLRHLAFYGLSIASGVLALGTKQNAAVLPVALVMVDLFFGNRERPGSGKGREAGTGKFTAHCSSFLVPRSSLLVYLVPFLLVTCLISYRQIGSEASVLKDEVRAQYWTKAAVAPAAEKPAAEAAKAAKAPAPVTLAKPPANLRLVYLATEFSVLWLYLRLLFLPYGQVFDYGYPLVGEIVTLQTAAAFLGLLLLFCLAVYVRKKLPLVSFGIFWFFLTLSVESTVIPLDAVMEHRLYMTMFGFALVVPELLRRVPRVRVRTALTCLVILIFSVLTWQRNSLWADTIAFARDNVRKAPHNQRNYLTLATAYADAGRWGEAEQTLKEAIKLRPDYYLPYDNLGTALFRQGKPLQALYFFTLAAQMAPGYPNALYNAGLALIQLGDVASAQAIVPRLKRLDARLAAQLEAAVRGGKR